MQLLDTSAERTRVNKIQTVQVHAQWLVGYFDFSAFANPWVWVVEFRGSVRDDQ